MPRIIDIIKDQIRYTDPINTWIDVGSNDGKTTRQLPWDNIATDKYSIEPYGTPVLGEEWKIVDTIEDVDTDVDLITMLDVIEHFEKEDGKAYLKKMEHKSKHIIIFTPLGFLQQDTTTHPEYDENSGMIHRSGWFPEDFVGYNIKILEDFHFPQGHNKHFSAMLVWR